ncbi:carbamoyltransferase HypF [Streptomyces sp. WAC05374]|uniref:carbamoyltransferase HypF n=1 Tax=Streptomyces sp. WAC05374 TaxID=2487420 RepID=UPI000F86CF14|nr:carbamoyltransferase HypF [Streptomyces sp. WAC05374]RST18346.1 carbamoyltransferase HypF [Streptomyces sp. WAC05374]TDF39117.1 carbamoyltransferase HypF [Streptomyces sp. WAC05374]TDF47460.1 carbamoyltransferase HypF [Streptomyces sp. WAC05374]TDF48225.1 carbamoyltransferase HypF [Streptomyces sp. WAC05374]
MAEYEQWRIRVGGVVQGVGYRPFVHTLATSAGLSGWVLNDTLGVQTEVRGTAAALAGFTAALRDRAPVLARVDEVRVESREPWHGDLGGPFEIRESVRTGRARTLVAPDSHVCDDCLREVLDPADRRHRYPFANCTHCGPRYSLIKGLPYDRAQTTMADFAMCGACRREYTDPADRRYHAQPTACPDCGPQVTLSGPDGVRARAGEALGAATEALAAGRIVAVKSLGGFHLAADARDARAVARLRARKKRDSKPFAVMAPDLRTVEGIARCTAAERELLRSPARPIVLLRKIPAAVPEEVAPRNPNLGVMLPSAPLHHLLLDRPGLDLLVMTSGNISGHPIAYRNEEALEQLFEVADLILHHDRDIHVRVDDSVVRSSVHPGLDEPMITFLRRSRGYAPYPVKVAGVAQPVIAYGAELKTTVALGDGNEVYVSQHIGDLKNDETYASHREAAAHLTELYELKPRFIACDMHPAFRARVLAATDRPEDVVEVQHHHAHMAACMAENQLSGTTVGVVFDGAGYGEDGTIWGGEFLLGDFREVRRAAHLRPVPLLGGDRAVAEPIRTGYALALQALGGPDAALGAFPALGTLDERQRAVFATMAERGIQSPPVTSMGRLFDGVAALLGVCGYAEYEAQGPIELEGLLGRDLTMTQPYVFGVEPGDGGAEVVDPRPVIRAVAADLARGTPLEAVSRRFHSAVVSMVVKRCAALRERHGVTQVVLSGGVFLNEFLQVNALVELRRAGFAAFAHRLVPPNDGGLALGQVMVADARTQALSPPGPNHGGAS